MKHKYIYLDTSELFYDDELNKVTSNDSFCESVVHILNEMLAGTFVMDFLKQDVKEKYSKGLVLEVDSRDIEKINIKDVCPDLDWDCIYEKFNEIFVNSITKG